MHCSRCRGLMIKDRFLDIMGQFGEMWAISWRCVNCGHVYDSVIQQHRSAPEKVLVDASADPDYEDEEVHLGAECFLRKTA